MQRDLVISRGRHDRNTNKSERRPQPRPQFDHPFQPATQQRSRPRRQLEDEGEEEVGWWQQPKQGSAAAESDELEEWQVERLEEAYAIGKRKVAVSDGAGSTAAPRSLRATLVPCGPRLRRAPSAHSHHPAAAADWQAV